jgi:hypothetical protein
MDKEEFFIILNGKKFVTYRGLLDIAHRRGLKSIEVEIVQLPTKENNMNTICKATAINNVGGVFIDYGDACPTSVNPKLAPHIIRMASTRAKARALRDLTNIGMTAIEELGE